MKLSTKILGVILVTLLAQAAWSGDKVSDLENALGFFDQNRDGNLNPYEVLDVLLMVQSESPEKALTPKMLIEIIRDTEEDKDEEAEEFMSQLDFNEDDKVTLEEAGEAMGDLAYALDKNENGIISKEEFKNMNFADMFSTSDEEASEYVAEMFDEFDANEDGFLIKREVSNRESWDRLFDKDLNGDSRISKPEMHEALYMESSLSQFKVEGETAVMFGVINSNTPAKVLELHFEHPNVRTLEMARVPGSVDDVANLRAATYVRNFGYNTILRSNSMVASGGTDFFLAGVNRVIEKGALVGVHSWGGATGKQGSDVPKDDPEHEKYLNYYDEMGISGDFYWYTLEAAPVDGIHWMSEKQLQTYNFRTTK